MEKVYLSKSRYCSALQCNKKIWMAKYKKDEAISKANEEIFQNGNRVGELAKGLFGKYINIEFNKDDLSQMIRDTNEALKKAPNIITEASFDYNNNFCSVDILKNDIDGVEIYEVKSSSGLKQIYEDDISYQYYVLNRLGLNVKKACLVHINREYVRYGELEVDKLFAIDDITDTVISKQEEIESKIQEINEYMNKYNSKEKEPEEKLSINCFEPYFCDYWEYCTKDLPENNVFKITGMKKKKRFDLYNEGKVSFEDLLDEKLTDKYHEQIEFEVKNLEPKIEKENIQKFLETLSYPIYFLDFETFSEPIPQFDGERPYDKIPFQYSLHYIEKEDGKLKHKEYLAEAGIDPRRKLAERLIEDIPMNVCVTAYNMGFEKSVIGQLAEMFPDISNHLLNIRNNIKDLMEPFSKRYYYLKELEGSYSIKDVLPTLCPDDPELDYHKLPLVHNGQEAPETYLKLSNMSEEERKFAREGLLLYCRLDTLAMVKVWEKLKEAVTDK